MLPFSVSLFIFFSALFIGGSVAPVTTNDGTLMNNAGGSDTKKAGVSGTQNAGGSGTQNAGGSGTHSSAPSNLQFVILEGSEFRLDKINSVKQKPYGSTIQTLRSYYDEGYELVGMAAKKFGHFPVFVYIMVKGTVRQQQQALLIENVQKIDALGKKNDLLAQKIDALLQNIDIVLPMKNASKKSDQKNDFSPPMNSLDKKKRDIRDGKKKESDE